MIMGNKRVRTTLKFPFSFLQRSLVFYKYNGTTLRPDKQFVRQRYNQFSVLTTDFWILPRRGEVKMNRRPLTSVKCGKYTISSSVHHVGRNLTNLVNPSGLNLGNKKIRFWKLMCIKQERVVSVVKIRLCWVFEEIKECNLDISLQFLLQEPT